MSHLLDTNVLSEWVKPRPDPRVVAWLAGADEDGVYLSVICFAELRRGVELMARGRRRDLLERWLEADLLPRFAGRILGVDHAVATSWGVLMAQSRMAGRELGSMDGLFAATAHAHALTLVTRNTRHFEGLGVRLLDPWSG